MKAVRMTAQHHESGACDSAARLRPAAALVNVQLAEPVACHALLTSSLSCVAHVITVTVRYVAVFTARVAVAAEQRQPQRRPARRRAYEGRITLDLPPPPPRVAVYNDRLPSCALAGAAEDLGPGARPRGGVAARPAAAEGRREGDGVPRSELHGGEPAQHGENAVVMPAQRGERGGRSLSGTCMGASQPSESASAWRRPAACSRSVERASHCPPGPETV
jgi:hypothetical protein